MMKIGIYFTARKEQGGVYSYSVEILEALYNIPGNKYIVFTTSPDIPDKYKRSDRFEIVDVDSDSRKLTMSARNFLAGPISIFTGKIVSFLNRVRFFNFLTPLYKISNSSYINLLNHEKPDLVIYPTSSYLSFLAPVPSIVTVHDLQHRLNPQFKEVSAGGMWEYREHGFVNIAKRAFRIFVDSEIGKKQMVRFYPKSKKRVVSLPYLAPNYLDSKISTVDAGKVTRYLHLPKKYIYYPAKFWPHKNHVNLVKALAILKNKKLKVNLVLSGSKDADFSSFEDVRKIIEELKLEDQVFYLGYLSDKELSAVYKLSTALIMPTFFGPTNIPVLEAWTMGVPVVYSDIEGCREQLGDAGLLIDPKDPKDIAKMIKRVYISLELRKGLIAKGKKRVKMWTRRDFANTIREVLEDFKNTYDLSKNN